MKATIITLCLVLFGTMVLQAQQLSAHFFNQFKAILTAGWEDVKGEEINKEGNEDNYVIAYDSKKSLDGFKVNSYQSKDEWGESKDVMATMEKPADNAPQLFDQIKDQLKKLQAEGYVLKPDADIPGAFLERISIYKGTNTDAAAKISLSKTGYIDIDFYKYQLPVSKPATVTLGPNFFNQFQAILGAKWEDVKSDNPVQKKDGGNGTGITIYNSKKKLDQFAVYAAFYSKSSSRVVVATRSSSPANEQLYAAVTSKVKLLQSQGHIVRAGAPARMESKSLLLFEKNNPGHLLAKIFLYQNNEIRIVFLKSSDSAATEKNKTQSNRKKK
jgi:hypothetical protein